MMKDRRAVGASLSGRVAWGQTLPDRRPLHDALTRIASVPSATSDERQESTNHV